jgi:hypothetical protein
VVEADTSLHIIEKVRVKKGEKSEKSEKGDRKVVE